MHQFVVWAESHCYTKTHTMVIDSGNDDDQHNVVAIRTISRLESLNVLGLILTNYFNISTYSTC